LVAGVDSILSPLHEAPILALHSVPPSNTVQGLSLSQLCGTNARARQTSTPLWYSNNAGTTWKKAATNGGISAEPWIMASGTNVIAARETKTNASDVYVTTSTNSGKTWTAKYLLSSTVPDSWTPMLGILCHTMYVAWRSNPGSSNSQEYVSVSINAGAKWSTPAAIGFSGHDNSWPTQVSVSGSYAFIMWSERTRPKASSPWDAVVQESNNNGTSWLASPRVFGDSSAESDCGNSCRLK
jgi:hypothetical protein